MNPLESHIRYPLGDSLPNAGQALPLADGIKWIRMGLPFALDHINLWLLRDRFRGVDGWTVVDCCIAHDKSKAQWEQIFANELEGLPIVRVIVTHMHPDHIGLADWLCQRWQAPLWISATDFHLARIACKATTGFGGPASARFFAAHGLTDPDALGQISARTNYYPSLVPSVPAQFHRLLDNWEFEINGQSWRCISGYGHAPEHMALYCAASNILISGDMVLPRISTNVAVYDVEPEADSLRHFLESIEKFLPLPHDVLVLPSHGKPFGGAQAADGHGGLHTRIEQLQAHHKDRLADVMRVCASAPQCAADILPVLFTRALDLHQTTFAMGEAIAHLHALWFQGHLTRQLGADGIYRFQAATAA